MTPQTCILIGANTQSGASQPGCVMGADAYRTAGIGDAIAELGFSVRDAGNINPASVDVPAIGNANVRHLAEVAGWVRELTLVAREAAAEGLPVFLGGDHSLSAGTVAGLAAHAASEGRPLFVLWLDAHPDLHTLQSTGSGHLHGTPVGYFTGQPGFEGYFPPLEHRVPPEQVCFMGLRSVDPAENAVLRAQGFTAHDMRAIDEFGVVSLLRQFLERVQGANGLLHVSLDVDFLDPDIAPAVGTTVPGGASIREAHLIMELLHESGLVTSLDLVELNPFLDERGRTAKLMVDLAASLLGRRVLDRVTRSF